MIDNKTYYEILEVPPDASSDEIKKSYRRLSFLYHPDKNPSKEEEFKKINEAYEHLSDNQKKRTYDHNLKYSNIEHLDHLNDFMMPGGENDVFGSILGSLFKAKKNKKKNQNSPKMNINDILNQFENMAFNNMENDNMFMFHGGMNANGEMFTNNINTSGLNVKPDIPEPLHVHKIISFEESYNGCCIPVNVTREILSGKHKQKEDEKIYLTLPKGVDDDEIITIENKGNIINGEIGDIKVHIKVEKHNNFERDGIHLIYNKNVTFKESLCGFNFVLNHINGNNMKLSSSRGNIIQNGDKKIIKNMGFERNDKFGDLIIKFHVSHPDEKLTDEQLKLIEDIF